MPRLSIAIALIACIGTVLTPLPADAQLTQDQMQRIQAAMPEQASAAPRQPRKLLIWNTPFMDESPHKGYTIPQSEYAFKIMGDKTGAYQASVSDDPVMLLPDNLKQFDAILLNNANGPWIRPKEEILPKLKQYASTQDEAEQFLRKSFLQYISDGGGLFAFHHAIGGNNQWPEFKELIGAGYWGHPWNEEVGVKLDAPGDPLLAVFQGNNFWIADEIFQFKEPYSREKVRVLLSLDVANTNMTVPWIHRKDSDFALAWVKQVDQGRVFYCAIGHRTEIWWNQTILKFYLDGLQFVMNDLDSPTDPK
ncbi:MAG: ThuA domain-containing protein [Candidatus Omnitrophica bacterium]|nr:ThuA domain-containing protein [Candidatus Omnitrophota bacterium]